ncbi:MAG: TonB-dependent receptor [Thiohalocapsa sp.]
MRSAIFIALLPVIGASHQTVAVAQDIAGTGDIVELELIEVTGSRIRRSEGEGASPVVIIDRTRIEQSGVETVSELMKKVIYNTAGARDETFSQGFAPASAAADLRGLGVSRTLVLVNGRRVPVFPWGQDGNASFVDLNLIPLGAVERVEILKDGASAVYGSDAIAGVVNIILRQEQQGGQVSLQYGATDQGDGGEGHIAASGGLTTDSANITGTFEFFDRDAIMARDRDISDSANGPIDDRSLAGDPGTIIRLAQGGRPEASASCPSGSLDPDKGPFCLYDFAPWVTLIPEVRRYGVAVSGDYSFMPGLTAFFSGTYTNSSSQRDLAPSSGGFFVDPGNPYNPYPGEPVVYVRRLTELGARTNEFTTDAWNLLGGLRGMFRGWDWEVGVGGGGVYTTDKGTNGYTTQDAMEEAIADGRFNPFGGNPGFDPDSVAVETRRDGQSTLFFTDAKASGDLLQMTHGALRAAFGAEYRNERFSDRWDPLSRDAQVLSVGGTDSGGSRDVTAFYAEFTIPALETLEVNLAGRYDQYSDFGGTFNPKLGLRWTPLPTLLLRGSAGTGFKAPSLPELYSGSIVGFDGVFDPVRGEIVEVDTGTAGNPDLDAEKSQNYGLGLVWDANDIWNLTLDWWRIDIDDAVSNKAQFYVDNEQSFPDNVIRGPDGRIREVLNPFVNIGDRNTWGIDTTLNFDWTTAAAGDFDLQLAATYLGSYEETPLPGADSVQLAGADGHPRWRARGILGWVRDVYDASLTLNYIGSYQRRREGTDDVDVGDWVSVDAQVGWAPAALRGGKILLGAENLFDEEPPVDAYFEGWPFFNRDLYSARGRFLYARYVQNF